MRTIIVICILALTLSGCSEATKRAQANGGVLILHDAQGRAYVCEPGVGDTFFIHCVKEVQP